MTKSWCHLAEGFAKEKRAFNAEFIDEKNKISDNRQKMLNVLHPTPKWLAKIAEHEYKERLEVMTALQAEHEKLLLKKYKTINLTDEQKYSNDEGYFKAVSELKFSYNLQKIKIDNYYQSRYDTQSRYEISRQSFSEGDDISDPTENKQLPATAESSLFSFSSTLMDNIKSDTLPCGCDDDPTDW